MTFEKILENIQFDNITLSDAINELHQKDKVKTINYFINKNNINKTPLSDIELSQLNALIEILQILYTAGFDTKVSDKDYDTLQEMLIDMGIPRLTGSVEINSASKINHQYLNLRGTLGKVYYLNKDQERTNKSRKYLDEWIKSIELKYKKVTGKEIDLNNIPVLLQPKFDGCSVVLEIHNDKMLWLTRGDTKVNKASDVSHIMNIFNNLYSEHKDCGIKFEVMITEDNKENINELYRDKVYKNSRQIVTAVLNSNEPDFKADYLYPIPLRIINNNDEIEKIYPGLIEKFPTEICKLSDRDTIKNFAKKNKIVIVNNMRFRTDGVVMTITDPEIQKVLGRENDINNFEIAYKFSEEYEYSKVKDIEFYVSEFGFITPVLVINDVILKGNTINRISLSNKERFDELGFSYGDDVKILYDVIPYATIDELCKKIKNGRKIEFIKTCPKCGSELDLNQVQVQCTNKECPSRLIGRILNFCSNLRIQNIGYQTLESLYKTGLLKNNIRSLFKLRKKVQDIENLDGFGKLKTKKIISEIESKRRLKDYELFGSIGIEGLSIKTFQSIFAQIKYSDFLNMLNLKNFELLMAKLILIEGIGNKKAEILVMYLKNNVNRIDIQKLLEEISIQETYGTNNSSKGKLVFSGIRPSEKDEKMLIENGWDVCDTWSNKTKYLIIPYENYESSKVTKAKELGIPIISIGDNPLLITLKQSIPNLFN